MEEFRFQPIGFVRGGGHYPQEAPRQGVYACNTGRIELLEHRNFETALADLAGFDRIWVLFVFDRAGNWKPKVRPPDGADGRRIGLFATRAPHRPNPIGISAVELVGVEGRSVRIRNFDLLDGTPVLDIKPYIPDVDAFPASRAGWRDEIPPLLRSFTFAPEAEQAIRFLRTHGGPDLENALRSRSGSGTEDPASRLPHLADRFRGDGTARAAADFVRDQRLLARRTRPRRTRPLPRQDAPPRLPGGTPPKMSNPERSSFFFEKYFIFPRGLRLHFENRSAIVTTAPEGAGLIFPDFLRF